MFRTGSPYSSFFMSGLLSNTNSVDFRRRGSLPTDTSVSSNNNNNERDVDQERSFLSLDLAESQSLHSEKRRQLVTQLSFDNLKMPHSAPLRMRSSRDTLRNVPSPKPAPSSTLPQVPRRHRTSNLKSPRLMPITNTATSLDSVSPSSAITPASSVLPTLSVTINTSVPTLRSNSIASASTVSTRYRRTKRSDALARLEGRSPHIVTSPLRSSGSNRNFMSMSDDEENEDDDEDGDIECEAGYDDDSDGSDSFVDLAMDFTTSPVSPTPRRKFENAFSFNDDEDVVIPRSPVRYSRTSRGHAYSHSLSPFSSPYRSRSSTKSLSSRSHRSHSQSQSQLYSLVHSAPAASVTSSPTMRRRRSRTLTMFPLKSFIDFKADAAGKDDLRSSRESRRQSLQPLKSEESWRWRSWIEIAGVS